MSNLVKKYPALSLFILALIFGVAPMAPVVAGLLPPAFYQLGALSASAAGIILAAVEGRKGGVRELLGRVLIWRVGIGWWLFALLFPAIPAAGSQYLSSLFGGPSVDWSGVGPLYSIIPLLLFLIVFAGLGEEFGWRGFAIPRLQTRYNALRTSLIIGAFHSLWHIPLFFVKGVMQHSMAQEAGLIPAFLGYAVFVIAFSVQLTWIFNNTKGSVLLAAVFHGAVNAWNGYIDIYRGHMAGVYAYMALMAAVAIVVVLIYGMKSLSGTKRSAPS
jgi:hypothetical protein